MHVASWMLPGVFRHEEQCHKCEPYLGCILDFGIGGCICGFVKSSLESLSSARSSACTSASDTWHLHARMLLLAVRVLFGYRGRGIAVGMHGQFRSEQTLIRRRHRGSSESEDGMEEVLSNLPLSLGCFSPGVSTSMLLLCLLFKSSLPRYKHR